MNRNEAPAMRGSRAPHSQAGSDTAVLRPLLTLAIPIVLANLVHTSHQLINTFWVGRLGADAVAAVSVSFPVIFLLISLGAGLSIAGSILAAQYFGARDMTMVRRVAGQTVTSTVIVSLAVSLAGHWLAPPLLRLIGVEAAVFGEAVTYLRISFAGVVFGFTFMMYQSLMRAVGDTRRPLYLVAGSVLVNVVLDPLLIFGIGPFPQLGVPGAAWATLIAQALAAMAGLRMLFSPNSGIHLRLVHLRLDPALILRVARLGLPASLEQSMQALGITAITLLVARFGTEAIAAYGIGMRVLTFVIIPAFGISMAASTLVGQSIGAGNPGRARYITRVSALLSLGVLGVFGLLIASCAALIVQVFVPGDPGLVSTGSTLLQWIAPAFALMGITLSFAGTYRGAGDTMATMLLSAIATWLVQLPLAWTLSTPLGFGATGIWMAYPLAAVINLMISWMYLRHGRWQRIRLTPDRALESRVGTGVLIEEGPG